MPMIAGTLIAGILWICTFSISWIIENRPANPTWIATVVFIIFFGATVCIEVLK